ncbi:MAG: sugar phosphate isomerase/epimerase [Tannerella sp.]|jgi:sugar phosphate isomerase/epimerase|nr:sugar phosphate isomerase/epimerase [Tannerella sp.]
MTNRRDFLRSASILTVGGLLSGKSGSAHAAGNPAVSERKAAKSFGLQIYSLGGELYKDVAGGLKKIGQMGYSTIELAGYRDGKINGVDMLEFKKMAEDAGLKIVSSHVNPPMSEYTQSNKAEIAEYWKKTADNHAKLGVKYLVQPGQPTTRSIEEVAFVCEIFNHAGEIAKAAGLRFGYHNHDLEYARVVPKGEKAVFGRHNVPKEAKVIYDLFLKDTDPALVVFQMDVYWTVMGQFDPLEYLKQYPDRIRILHIKDRAVLGQSGMMNFENIFKQAYANGIEDFFVELEGVKNITQFEGVKGCADYLLKAPFVK